MAPPGRSPFVLYWRWPLLLSLLLHGGLGLSLALLPGRGSQIQPPNEAPVWIVSASGADVAADLDLAHVEEETLLKPSFPAPPPLEPEPLTSLETPAGTEESALPGGETSHPGAAGKSRGAGADPGPAFCEVPGTAKSVVYILDCSASMGPSGAFAAARREVLASLAQLPPTVRFQILVYSSEAHPLRLGSRTELVEASVENRRQAAEQLADLALEGRTVHLAALKRALALGAEVIFFLTDADDLKLEEVREVTRLNHLRRVIHTIELRTENGDRPVIPLQVLARENGGRYQAWVLGTEQ
jgi:hypothetical protein